MAGSSRFLSLLRAANFLLVLLVAEQKPPSCFYGRGDRPRSLDYPIDECGRAVLRFLLSERSSSFFRGGVIGFPPVPSAGIRGSLLYIGRLPRELGIPRVQWSFFPRSTFCPLSRADWILIPPRVWESFSSCTLLCHVAFSSSGGFPPLSLPDRDFLPPAFVNFLLLSSFTRSPQMS